MSVYSTNDLRSPLAPDRDEEYTPCVAGGRDAGPAACGGKLSEREGGGGGDWLGSPVDNAPPASVLHVTESPSDDTGEEDAYGDEELVQRH